MNITVPAIVNGQILPGGVDRYRFQARKGMELVVVATARELIPYLADAVPGWFQAALALYDAKGNELEHADHYRFHPDPVLYYEIPKDGEYVVEIRDSIYRGREDFVYRITLGELPYHHQHVPAGRPSRRPNHRRTQRLESPGDHPHADAMTEPGIYPLSVRKEDRVSNHVPFAVDTLAGMPRTGAEQLAGCRPAGHPADHRQRAH